MNSPITSNRRFFIPATSLSFSHTFLRKNSSSDSVELKIFEVTKAIKNNKVHTKDGLTNVGFLVRLVMEVVPKLNHNLLCIGKQVFVELLQKLVYF